MPGISPHLSLRTSRRVSTHPQEVADVWSVVAGAGPGPHWYVDAWPFVLRGALDRAVLGGGRRWAPPDRPLLAAGDLAGFWVVRAADDRTRGHRLVLEAAVRAPGLVRLTALVTRAEGGTELDLQVRFDPAGVLGAAYLVADLPARETLLALVDRRLRADLAGVGWRSGA